MTKRQKASMDQRYEIGEETLGRGGNADVHECISKTSKEKLAIKALRNWDEEKIARFKDEIHIVRQYGGKIPGILPIVDYDEENCWYVMHIAQKCIEKIKSLKADDRIGFVVAGVIQLAETLIQLHEKGVYHRDIKPDNIYYYNDRFTLGDFGLVEFPEKGELTRSDKALGAIFTIAPEMKRDPKSADGTKADVYSLAKTLWMFLTENYKGFDGRYDFTDNTHSLHSYVPLSNKYLVEIERLLLCATDNSPENRPDMFLFKKALEEWKASLKDEKLCEKNEWDFLAECIFPDLVPRSAIFTKKDKIVKVLNLIGNSPAMNHMLFKEGGGLDFSGAMHAAEEGCIYIINRPFWSIIKPAALYFETFDDCRWNYFLLEAEHLDPIISEPDRGAEKLVEDTPGHYVSADNYIYGVYDYDTGEKFPEGYKLVHRYVEGKFLLVLKAGPYNKISRTYDGRHGDMTNTEFRAYIENLERTDRTCVEAGYDEEDILRLDEINAHPYPERTEPFIMESETTDPLPDGAEFVKKNFESWSFYDIISAQSETTGKLAFSFTFDGLQDIVHTLTYTYYLSNNGMIKNAGKHTIPDAFYVYDRGQAMKVRDAITTRIESLCSGFDSDSLKIRCRIELHKNGNPSHLFTKEEIEAVMRAADDRTSGRLVIDEDGFARVISTNEECNLYPVAHEAYLKSVGKYSDLNDLDQYYGDSLACWLEYLWTGVNQFCDENKLNYCDEVELKKDEESLLEKIYRYYSL